MARQKVPGWLPGSSWEDRPNGTFRVAWRHQGRQVKVTVDSMRTAKLLNQWLARNGTRPADDPDLMRAIGRAPRQTMADPTTVGEALEKVLEEITPQSMSIRRHQVALLSPLHHLTMAELSQGDVAALMEDLKARVAENTWRGAGTFLARALRPHGLNGLVKGYTGNPKGKRDREPVVMTRAQMDELVWLGRDQRGLGDLLAILTDLGLRFGEAAALRGTHVERIAGQPFVLIREQNPSRLCPTVANPHPPAQELKSGAGIRNIPPSPRILDMAAEARTHLLTVDPVLGGPWRHPLATWHLAQVSRVAIREGIISRPVHFHDFRHSWGANLLLGGVDIVTVSKLMGHSSPTITGNIYGHLTQQGLDKVRDLLK